MRWISSILLDGVELDLDQAVLADVTIRHGRNDVYDGASPSTCQLTLLDVTRAFTRKFKTGAALVVNASEGDPAVELVTNGGAENGITGWTGSNNNVIESSAANAHSGDHSFRIDPAGVDYAGLQVLGGYGHEYRAGVPYQARAYFLLDGSAGGHTLTIAVGGHPDAGSIYHQLWAGGGWNELVLDVPPASVDWTGYMQVYIVDSAAAGVYFIDDVSVRAAEEPRFTGRVTDGGLDDDVARLTVIAVGRLSTLQQYTVGAADWPAEPWSARVARVFDEAGLTAYLELVPDPESDPMLAARVSADDGGPRTLDTVIGELAGMVGAAVADRPNGNILVQEVSARRLDDRIVLDPNLVEYAPAWVQVLPLSNVVTVKYAGGEVTVRDETSVQRYGERPGTIETTFTSEADATARAHERVGRTAWPHWNMPGAPVLAGLDLPIGAPVEVSMLPASAPYDLWTPVVEGWLDRIAGDEWTMEVALSDPLASGLTLPWDAVPADYLWSTIDQATPWVDALTLSDLEP